MRACRSLLLFIALVGVSPLASGAELEIVNTSGKAIHELYLAAQGARGWGQDRLRQKQSRMIASGENHTVIDVAPGSYELMLVDADGSECQIDFVDITVSSRLDLTRRRLRECTSSH